MGCKSSKIGVVNEPKIRHVEYDYDFEDDESTIGDSIVTQRNIFSKDLIIHKLVDANEHIDIQVADSQAFNPSFIQQRQQAIDQHSYRSVIELWKPKSLKELVATTKTFSEGKSLIDRHWIIFYWVAYNIEYDTVAYFAKDYKDQSAEGVFGRKKGVCAGYANIYKYLCDQLKIPCKVVVGYAKGYGFDSREGAPTETNHAWNTVEIDRHWYLIESTWGAGVLNDEKLFERKFNTYYFLARPNEMIYHHLPEDEKWQLLRTPIKMMQYMQMPKLCPLYFELDLKLISPCNQAHVNLLPEKPYALVLIRAPSDVHLIADFKLNSQEVDGGHYIIFNKQEKTYQCYFAPADIGKHKITIYGNRGGTETGKHSSALDLILDIKQIPTNPISFPKTWQKFFDLDLEVISPQNTRLIKLNDGATHAQIRIKTPENVALLGRITNKNGEVVKNGSKVYFDRRKKIWQCNFAPDCDGVFEALIMAKKKSDPGSYTAAVSFKVEAKQTPLPCISYPETWPLFYDLGLKVVAPKDRANIIWPENASFAEVLIKAPDDVQLSCEIEYDNNKIKNGSVAQFDNEKKLWQLLFAPERIGFHELIVYAIRTNNTDSSSGAVVRFNLNVTKLRQPMKFPLTYTQFQATKCQIFTPMNGILKKGSVLSIHCVIPGAKEVGLQVDSKWLKSEGYQDPILKRSVEVGSNEVAIYAKYGEKLTYDGLIKYTVE